MRPALPLLIAALAACSREPAPAPAPAPPTAPASAPSVPEGAKQALAAANAAQRRQIFAHQRDVPAPAKHAPMFDRLRALVPPDLETRLVTVEVKVGMGLARRQAGRTTISLTFITPASTEEATAALSRRFDAEGWKGAPSPTLRNDAGDRLDWILEGHDDQPPRVTVALVLERPVPALPGAADLPEVVPVWLPDAPAPAGYEFGRFHARRPGADISDVERLALAFHTPDAAAAAALAETLVAAVRARGYTVDARDGRLWRGPGGTTFTMRSPGPEPGDLVVHHQRRWNRD